MVLYGKSLGTNCIWVYACMHMHDFGTHTWCIGMRTQPLHHSCVVNVHVDHAQLLTAICSLLKTCMCLFGYYKEITFFHTPANEFHDTSLLPVHIVATLRARAPYRLTPPPPPPPPPPTHTHTMLRPSLYIALSTVVFFNTTQQQCCMNAW